MVNRPHGREIQRLLGVRSLLLRSILRLVQLNGLFVARNIETLWYMSAAILSELSNVCDEDRALA
jgi:hypothetical protein